MYRESFLTISSGLLALLLQVPAAAQLSAVGPVSPDHGFPLWYRDGQDTQLDLCLVNTGFCLLESAVELLDPGQPFPLNYGGTFPDESFYWAGEASMPTNNGGNALLVMALEAAFANEVPLAGDQMVFGRIRIRADNLVAGASYHVTTPYGEFDLVAQSTGARGINFTQDIGTVPGAFTLALAGGIGPFLRWDSGLPIVDSLGNQFIGDPNIEHTVTGSPIGKNFFRIDGPSVGGPGVDSVSTDLFSVMGMLSSAPTGGNPPVANFSASPLGGIAPLNVAFTDLSTGAITAWTWDFGDSTGSLLQNPSHTYATPGSYTVSLTVTGPNGSDTRTVPTMINVTAPPALTLSEPSPGLAGRKNQFTVTNATPNADVVLIASSTPGSGTFTARNCVVTTGLEAPRTLATVKSRTSTVRIRLAIGRALAGTVQHYQAIDTGNCTASNVVSHRW